MAVGGARCKLDHAAAELAVQGAHELAHALEREAFAAQFADYGNFCELCFGVNATAAIAARDDDLALVPPLQLARANAGALHHLRRCELPLVHSEQHPSCKCLKHLMSKMCNVNS